MAMQTTCDVNGHRLMNCLISARFISRVGPSAIFSASRNKYSCCASSKFSSGSAEVSMSNISVAIGNKLVLEESIRLGNQIVVGVADNFGPGKFSNRQFAPRAN